MKSAALLLAIAVTAASGQWLEANVFIPDSLGGLRGPNCLAYDPADSRVFVAGESTRTILVLDARDGHRLGRIPFKTDISALCYSPLSNKIYAAAPDHNAVGVIDAATMHVVKTVPAGTNPCALACSPTSNKVFCVNCRSDDVTVIDGAGDSVLAVVKVGTYPCAVCWNPARNVVYVANSNSNNVSVIDAAADTVVATIPTGYEPLGLVYNPDLNRLYEADLASGNVTVIDGRADTVLTTISGGSWPHRLCYNPANSKVYVTDGDGEVLVIDCTADTLLRAVNLGACSDVVYNSRDNRVYAAAGYGLDVIDGVTDAIVATVSLGNTTSAVCLADSGRRVFGAVYSADAVGVVDCATDSLIAVTSSNVRLSAICLNIQGGKRKGEMTKSGHSSFPLSPFPKVYCADSIDDTVTVINGSTHTIVGVVPVSTHPVALLHDPVGNKVYCSNSGDDHTPATLTVISDEGDSVLRTIVTGTGCALGGHALCLDRTDNRVYVGIYLDASVAAVDAAGDTIIARSQAGGHPVALCYSPAYHYVYAATSGSAVGVIDCELSVLIADVATSGNPVALIYDSVGAKVYTANGSTGKVSVIAGARPEVVAEIQACSWASALCLDTKEDKVYCADLENREVAVIDAAADVVIARVPVGNEPSALSYDALNDYVYCTCRGSNDVYVINAHRDTVVTHIGVGAEPSALAWNPTDLRTYVLNYGSSSVSVLRDSLHPGIEETMNDERRTMNTRPTIVRGILFLPPSLLTANSSLLSIDGRRVLDLHPGANDVRGLAPGVYFVRAASRKLSAVSCSKVVVTR